MKNDLISREEAMDVIKSLQITLGGKNIFRPEAKASVLECLDFVPTVDAEPVRHGVRTVYTIWHSSAWGEIHTKFECCGFDVRGTKKYNYCPNCGAKMDGGVE